MPKTSEPVIMRWAVGTYLDDQMSCELMEYEDEDDARNAAQDLAEATPGEIIVVRQREYHWKPEEDIVDAYEYGPGGTELLTYPEASEKMAERGEEA